MLEEPRNIYLVTWVETDTKRHLNGYILAEGDSLEALKRFFNLIKTHGLAVDRVANVVMLRKGGFPFDLELLYQVSSQEGLVNLENEPENEV